MLSHLINKGKFSDTLSPGFQDKIPPITSIWKKVYPLMRN